MAIRLIFDIIGSTCGDLLRFADAVRAAGAQPEYPLQQGSGPNRIEVVVDDRGPRPMPPHLQRPADPPGPYPSGPYLAGPQFHHEAHGFTMSGSFPPGFSPGPPRYMRRPGCVIGVNWGARSRETEVPIDTVGKWSAALDKVLESNTIDEPTRAALRELRQAFSDQEMPPGYPGGS